jgi:hypothetical protein
VDIGDTFAFSSDTPASFNPEIPAAYGPGKESWDTGFAPRNSQIDTDFFQGSPQAIGQEGRPLDRLGARSATSVSWRSCMLEISRTPLRSIR